ncbi:divalent-cation tolerance protein CutA [Methylovulum psychrotolerans]|jgi:periplasmic divalent cation tolerance protein|uniref:Divalent-cation tolerance protein CutA n=1 Tax=Methylovulum psychrotolerans TaxID=1704499 RepID=A0A1Z4BVS6_9GAMM|nr:divalent-cation tolerance protein CutA [Methylovulum psychrotolerans]ASF45350.1 divalent-cation tolerance protein CutA [Methylovulum psychrotolerans]POZ52146.1 divalent-cation tolerance protein CutA [Methylovulum psychrotolerans]
MPTNVELILCTCPDKATAKKLAHLLVSKKLAACVNIIPGITSVYSWEEQIESVTEQLLLIKTSIGHYAAIETLLFKYHPYELPEIIAVPIERGLPEYLDWITTCLSTKQ